MSGLIYNNEGRFWPKMDDNWWEDFCKTIRGLAIKEYMVEVYENLPVRVIHRLDIEISALNRLRTSAISLYLLYKVVKSAQLSREDYYLEGQAGSLLVTYLLGLCRHNPMKMRFPTYIENAVRANIDCDIAISIALPRERVYRFLVAIMEQPEVNNTAFDYGTRGDSDKIILLPSDIEGLEHFYEKGRTYLTHNIYDYSGFVFWEIIPSDVLQVVHDYKSIERQNEDDVFSFAFSSKKNWLFFLKNMGYRDALALKNRYLITKEILKMEFPSSINDLQRCLGYIVGTDESCVDEFKKIARKVIRMPYCREEIIYRMLANADFSDAFKVSESIRKGQHRKDERIDNLLREYNWSEAEISRIKYVSYLSSQVYLSDLADVCYRFFEIEYTKWRRGVIDLRTGRENNGVIDAR